MACSPPAITSWLTCSCEELYGWHCNLDPEQLGSNQDESDSEPAQLHPQRHGGRMRKALMVAAEVALGGVTVRLASSFCSL